MKNTHNIIKAVLASTLFFSIPVLLKADESQEKTKSDNSTLNRHIKEIEFNMSEKFEEWKCNTECILNSEYLEFCKAQCTAKHFIRVGRFKVKRFFEQ